MYGAVMKGNRGQEGKAGLPLCSGRVVPVPSEHSGTANWHLSQYRTLLPFFLIIAVVLLLIWRLVPLPIRIAPVPSPSTTLSYIVQPGDTCWDIANDHNSSLDKLLVVNPKVNCEKLMPGGRVCVPDEGMSISVRFWRFFKIYSMQACFCSRSLYWSPSANDYFLLLHHHIWTLFEARRW